MKNFKVVTLRLATRLQDNGDGGYTTYAYNNQDELIQNHPRCSDYQKNPETGRYENVFIGCSDELREEILNEDDPYENGYISSESIKLRLYDDGTVELDEPLSIHGGQ